VVKSALFETASKAIGSALGKGVSGATGFAIRHPMTTLLGIGALALSSQVFDRANKVRGLHQIVTEHSKSKAMQRQENLLRKIYEVSATKAVPVNSKPERSNIITPPLR
jgi:hypothetical protein